MKISKKGIILLIIALAGLSFLIYNYSQQAGRKLRIANTPAVKADKQPLSADGQAAKTIFEQTLSASNNKDAKLYVSYLIPKARKNTAAQLSDFFKQQDVTNSLLSYRVLKEKDSHLLAEAKVKSINKSKNQKQYRDNIATLNVSYVKQKGQWLIDLTTTIDTHLLKK
jgi:ABC-type Na+ efflux pump permease subunit